MISSSSMVEDSFQFVSLQQLFVFSNVCSGFE
jgi:hypothetical protein